MSDDEKLQHALLNHPAYRSDGVHPNWRIIAICGWVTVGILVLLVASR